MPSREYSAYTVGLSWPLTNSGSVRSEAEANMQAADEAGRAGEATRDLAERFVSETSGRFAGAMYQGYINDSEIDFAKEKFLTEASQAGQKVADEVLAAKSHLDHLDWDAHQKIEEMAKAGPLSEAAKWALIGQTSVAAASYVTGAAAQIASQAAKITAAVNIPHRSGGTPNGTPGKPFHESPKIDRPGEVKPMGNEHGKEDGEGRGGSDGQPHQSGTGEDKADKAKDAAKEVGNPTKDASQLREGGQGRDTGSKQPSLGNAAGASPFSGGSPSGSGGSGSGSPASGLGSGLMGGGSNPAQALQSGLKGAGGSPGSGLSSGGSGLGKGMPGGGGPGSGSSAAQMNPVRDFARGFSSSAGSSATPLAQPASHAAPPPAPAAPAAPAPAAGTSAPASPLSGMAAPPPAAAPPPPGVGGAGVGGAGPNPSGLAPVGSDMARHAAAAPGPGVSGVAPSGGSSGSSATSIAGTAGTAAMGAGLLGVAHGSSANRAGAAPRDPLLADAVELVFKLMHASRFYPGIDWCAAVFRSEGVTETVITSNEGAGYIPVGVFIPRSVRHLFSDSLVSKEFEDEWFGHTDPVATMMAYAELRRGQDGLLPVHALAASSLMGGALAAAETAGVEHLHLCDKSESPYQGSNVDQVLDELHVHRLGVIDPGLLSWMHSSDRTLSEITAMADELSTKAFHATSARLGTSQIIIPDVGAAVFNQLSNGEVVDESLWDRLFTAMQFAQGAAGAARPSADSGLGIEVYRCRHDVVRLLEMLYWWRPVGGEDAAGESICFTELAYSARQIVEGDQ